MSARIQKKQKYNKNEDKYPETMDLNTVKKLEKGAQFDYRDVFGRFLGATILQIVEDPDTLDQKHGIHYPGWRNFWNHWSYPEYQYQRYAEHESISKRPLHRNCMEYIELNKPHDDLIEVKPLHLFQYNMFKREHVDKTITIDDCNKYLNWHIGQVVAKDRSSAQVQCELYEYCEKNNTWSKSSEKTWVHLDNDKECAPINTNILHYSLLN